jgi:hypothetical protein
MNFAVGSVFRANQIVRSIHCHVHFSCTILNAFSIQYRSNILGNNVGCLFSPYELISIARLLFDYLLADGLSFHKCRPTAYHSIRYKFKWKKVIHILGSFKTRRSVQSAAWTRNIRVLPAQIEAKGSIVRQYYSLHFNLASLIHFDALFFYWGLINWLGRE